MDVECKRERERERERERGTKTNSKIGKQPGTSGSCL
jgi:hypothetical protein